MMKDGVFLWILVASMILSGAGSTMTQKAQQLQIVAPCQGCAAESFNHSYMQTFFMFMGELMCIFVWLVIQFVNKQRKVEAPPLKEGKRYYKFYPNVFLFLVPTVCDLISSTFNTISLYYSLPSVRLVLSRCTALFIAIFSFCIWRDYRKKFDLPQVVGLLMLFTGAAITAVASIMFSTSSETAKNPTIGVVTSILGSLFASFFYVSEEVFLRKIQTTGLMGVSNEGGWGMIIYAILLPIFNVVPDPFDTTKKMENLAGWAFQVKTSAVLQYTIPIYLVFTIILNASGMEITNRASAATRSTVGAQVTIVIWIISFAIGWESWDTKSTLTRIAGFILVTLGALIYNNIFKIIPFLKQYNIKSQGRWMGKGGKEEQKIRESENILADIIVDSIINTNQQSDA
ncbi:Transmembrane domain-containing protein [Spironucleus salmonicida]|uniref:Transmembrane domain-containing protein n=2 Tax=Spironucleus salmonicida TaxID=348837 RepID=A0A9P8S1M9_9EUKA|nr:Transmembrane domain-containing protein [Spironucleus salmonicida]